jgi:2-dehydro-3-deoxyphosphogluconate aldolase/(4S)-4-hydroxy-2-oxoglutarate aldolase
LGAVQRSLTLDAIEELARQRVLPVLRCADAEDTIATARAAGAAGCRVVEVTMSTPGAEAAIEPLVADGLVVAVGTVRHAADVPRLAEAGASLVVSFWNPPGFVAAAAAAGIPAIPGGFTTHELAAAHADGAAAVKLFPASLAGPAYLAALRPLLPELRLLVTGGIAADGVGEWLEAGALAVGLGSNLGTAATVGADEVERRCRTALAAA